MMGFGHMVFEGGKSARAVDSGVTGHPVVFEQDFHGVFGEPHVHLFFGQLIGNAVEVAVDFDMVVDVDPGLDPFGKFVGRRGQRF